MHRTHLFLVLILLSAVLAMLPSMAPDLPTVLLYIFKPLTTILIMAWAWPRGRDQVTRWRWIMLGLLASLGGDVALLWPQEGFVPGLVSFLAAHLLYIAAFTVTARFAQRWEPFALYGAVALAILSLLWSGVPQALQIPVLAYVACLACMASQGLVWAMKETHFSQQHQTSGPAALAALKLVIAPGLREARMAAAGGAVFLLSDALLATDRFYAPLPQATMWVFSTYWLAQCLIVGCLRRS